MRLDGRSAQKHCSHALKATKREESCPASHLRKRNLRRHCKPQKVHQHHREKRTTLYLLFLDQLLFPLRCKYHRKPSHLKSRNADSTITDEELQSITDFANENLLKNDISKVELENRDADDVVEYCKNKVLKKQ